MFGPGRVAQHLRKADRNSVVASKAFDAELTVRLGHRTDETHASWYAVELGRDEAIRRQNEIGPYDARNFLFEPVLARELDDLFGFSPIEVLGNERRRGSAHAAIVKIV